MEKDALLKDLRSFECSSLSELDRKFTCEQSLLSALSLDQLSTSNDAAADRSRLSNPGCLCVPLDSMSLSQTLPASCFSVWEGDTCTLAVPLLGKSSTPQVLIQSQKTGPFDQSCPQVSWDVSLIKSENSSPRPGLELSVLELTWSPNLQSAPPSLAELSQEDVPLEPPCAEDKCLLPHTAVTDE